MQTELEKTQLEIAKLQLEQEHQKLAQMQRRQQAVQGLGQGAAAVGGAAVRGGGAALRWAAKTLIAWGAFIGFLIYAAANRSGAPAGDMLYRIGYAAGSLTSVEVLAAFALAVAAGFAKWTKT